MKFFRQPKFKIGDKVVYTPYTYDKHEYHGYIHGIKGGVWWGNFALWSVGYEYDICLEIEHRGEYDNWVNRSVRREDELRELKFTDII